MVRKTKISDTKFEKLCDPQNGDCGSVAVAINDSLNGEDRYHTYYLLKKDIPNIPYHVVCEIDGELYDSNGRVSHTQMIENCKDAINTPSMMDDTAEGIAERNFRVLGKSDIEESKAFDEDTYQRVLDMLL